MFIIIFFLPLYAVVENSGIRTSITSATTITTPGTYYLSWDIVGTMTISASDVELDLNGKTIDATGNPSGIVVTNQTNVSIYNGHINDATTQNIEISGSTNVTVTDVTFDGGVAGVSVSASQVVAISQAFATGITALGVFVTTSTNIDIQGLAVINAPCYGGVYAEHSQNITISESVVNNNALIANPSFSGTTNGYFFNSCTNIAISDCIMNTNTGTSIDMYAYRFVSCSSIQVARCVTASNGTTNNFYGFHDTSCVAIEYTNCGAKRNDSSTLTQGFNSNSVNALIIRDGTVLSCTSSAAITGISVVGGSSFLLEHCRVTRNIASGGAFNGIATSSSATAGKIINCTVDHNSAVGVASNGVFIDQTTNTEILDCISCNTNISSGVFTATGFLILDSSNIIILRCIGSHNTSTSGDAVGFWGTNVPEITFRDNIAASNIGGVTSSGFVGDGTTTNYTVWTNQSQLQGANNYVGFTLPSPMTIDYDQSLGTFATTPTPYSNISVIS